ncbi:Sodium:neurotransmitter symporter family-containing protein [Strongyloides ratti]|uniref:Transporter n=1 Tax=Strongyloides ratti TaxID=34506 RepID=A0A090KVY0_STRRB|nr:Sodium:neurotransmitter symporter family-containing protein [Strongyloides ratti]CEF60036.1 Sodium:neurotransmitter symporter family-containing protein [Strongyloides ratti]
MSENKNRLQIPLTSKRNGNNIGPDKKKNRLISSNTNDDITLGSRVTFSEESVVFQTEDRIEVDESHTIHVTNVNREGWDNKTQFMMGVISYAVGLGNVWRFPYLCQKNGGGAFLIPYIIMMFLEGMPLFLIELGIGQRLRTGPVGVWNTIHPYLGGVGVSAAIVSFLVAVYYNVIITWCIYYLYNTFSLELPWSKCPVNENGTIVEECRISSSPTSYFWNREAINTSGSIGDFDGFVNHITFSLIIAWILIYLCVNKGIKSSGKVMYLTATFPYIVTTIFLIRSIMLDGAMDGIIFVLTPDLTRLYDPEVWLEAATQIFYSMGLGFGGLIAFGSYNPLKNNSVVIFCVIGYMGHKNYMNCIDNDMKMLMSQYPKAFTTLDEMKKQITIEEYENWMAGNFHYSQFPLMGNLTKHCNYKKIINQAAEGTGLAFVVFTEAIIQFPFPPMWAFMFFMMLLMLGLGSMFGTLEGVITSLNDSHIITVPKPIISAVLCSIACSVGLVFTTHAGQYWVSLFDHFAGSYALMGVAFFEAFAVIYVYGYKKFCRDLEYMTGDKIERYWLWTWRFISPSIMFILFFTSIIKSFSKVPEYFTYDKETSHQVKTPYPVWALFIAFGMVLTAIAPVPIIWFVRKFKVWNIETDIPAASRCLNSTASTTQMLKSQQSFNRMAESTASELQTIGTT